MGHMRELEHPTSKCVWASFVRRSMLGARRWAFRLLRSVRPPAGGWTRRRRSAALALVLAACALPARCAENAATTTLVYPCLPTRVPITVDGRLEPTEWEHAVEAAGFTVSGSDTLVPEQVLMRLTYDHSRLYLGITCLESNMEGLKTGGASQRDGEFWFDDSVEFFVNPSHDHESFRQFAVTAKGIRYDNLQGDSTWNADWEAAAVLAEGRWTVEIGVAFVDLGPKPPSAGAFWGFNLCRERQAGGRLELYNWANVERVFNRAELFGHLVFVAADWRANADTVGEAVRHAGGTESRLFVGDGYWSTRAAGPPTYASFLEQLRREDKACPPFITKLAAVYAAAPDLPYGAEYRKLAASYAEIRTAIAAGRPLPARLFDRYSARLKELRVDSENVYWRARLAELNQSMR